MKLVILAGGYGTRLTEETAIKPKPMAEIGGKPIIWHIMKYYSCFGLNDFIVLTGYKGEVLNKYFYDLLSVGGNIELNFNQRSIKYINNKYKDWRVTCYYTGLDTMTGGRLKKIEHYLKDETFCMTYGDGLSNVDIKELISFHVKHKKIATVTAVKPIPRFGSMHIENNTVKSFIEKPNEERYINGGFFVLNKDVFKYLKSEETIFEREPLEELSKHNELRAFMHDGFWHPMDTIRDKNYLNDLWESDKAKWRIW